MFLLQSKDMNVSLAVEVMKIICLEVHRRTHGLNVWVNVTLGSLICKTLHRQICAFVRDY